MYEVKLIVNSTTYRAKTLRQASRLSKGAPFIARKCGRKGKKGPWAKYVLQDRMAHREVVQCPG